MKIEINNSQVIDIKDACLTVKNGKLFNTVTKQFEGVDGDRVTFHVTKENGSKCWVSGTVDGYTCDRRVKLRGVDTLYTSSIDCIKIIESLSKITDTDCEKKEQTSEDWETILSA